MIVRDYFTTKAKKSGGMKNKLYFKRNQGRQVSDFPSYSKNIFTLCLLSFYRYPEANGY